MKLKTKIILNMGLVFLLFSVAISVALTGMQSTKSRFESFLEHDLALAQAATNQYAQGLQLGQALRNIVIDPANKTAFKNLETAGNEFKETNQKALALAKNDPADLKVLEEVAALREQQIPIQAKIVSLAATNQAAAIEVVSKEETPVWRSIRVRLQDYIKAKSAAVENTKAEMAAFSQRMLVTALVLMLVAMVVGAGIVFWLIRHIMQQLGGEPVYAAEVARAISAGDFSREITVARGDSSSLLFTMNAMRENLTVTIGDIRQSTETIAVASRQIASGNADLSSRTESQASSLEETASSMEELTSTVKQNAENARQANQLVVSAADVAVKGGKVVGQVVNTMASIKDSSRKIADIISVIDGIAFQTNILALNAAVEAARAGEQGRGFAVVAAEVRNLAQRSAGAAKEIKSLIEDSVDKVDVGGKLVDEAGKTMDEIVNSVKRVTDIMSEIAAASQEQSSGIEQVNQAVGQMDEATQQNAALVEEAAAAAESLQDQAAKLAQAVSLFKLGEGSQPARHAQMDIPVLHNQVKPKPKAAPARMAAQPKKLAGGGRSSEEWEEF
ncbi:methyl-accepting chemotaxis protein [Sulfuriferula sp.]|uniref:methyl-accepting chemotaxis protein n=1 Tax=Sulfuriferula sp. TaxID=2025307 RepID=UPI00272EEE86|nr:methyl-accepting chemotaxis protein [Sulfuriferula sp.]MDP2025162.1 methyl-accepting chemotaxis protein [Sulfuriferula sp.]